MTENSQQWETVEPLGDGGMWTDVRRVDECLEPLCTTRHDCPVPHESWQRIIDFLRELAAQLEKATADEDDCIRVSRELVSVLVPKLRAAAAKLDSPDTPP